MEINANYFIENKEKWFNPNQQYQIDSFWKSISENNRNVIKKESYKSLFYHFEFELRENKSSKKEHNYLIEMHISRSHQPLSESEHKLIQLAAPVYVDLHYGIKKYTQLENIMTNDFHLKAYPSQILLGFESKEMALSYYEEWKNKILSDHLSDLEEEEILSRNIELWKKNI